MEGDTSAASEVSDGGLADAAKAAAAAVADSVIADPAGVTSSAGLDNAGAGLTKMQVPQPPGSAAAAAASIAAAAGAVVADDEDDSDDGPYPYRATAALLVALHLVFLHQWNSRRRREDVQCSYRSLVVERKYHGAVLAFLSHAGGDLAATSSSSSDGGSSSGALSSLRDAARSLTRGGLSGLPLLGYSSHLLWKLKPLEPYLGGAVPYCRVAAALVSVAVAVELMLRRMVLNCLSSHHRAFGGGSRTNRDAAWHVMARGTSGASVLVGALLVLDAEYRLGHHRRGGDGASAAAPPQPEPAAVLGGQIVLAIRLTLLTALSWRYHRSGPLVGALSGALFASNATAFLAERYWSNALLIAAGLACAASLKASGGRGADYVPCVDFVAWDASGRYRRGPGEAGGAGAGRGGSSRRRGGAGDGAGAADDSDGEGESSVATDDEEVVAVGGGGGGGDIESAGTTAAATTTTPRSRGVRANGAGAAETYSASVDGRAGGGVLRSGSGGVGGAFSRQGGSSRRRPEREDTS